MIHIFYISDNFFICPDGYFYTNAFCLQFLNHFSLPDVASVIMPLVHIVSFIVSVSVTVPDDAVQNTVDFVFIFVSGAFTHTLL